MKSTHLQAVLIALFVPCLALAQDAPKSAPPTKEGATASGHALVWKIEGAKCSVYLAGSIHLLKKSDYPLPSAYDAAYQDADEVWFEIPPSEMASPKAMSTMLKSAMLTDGKQLSDVVKESTMKAIGEWCAEKKIPREALNPMKPWMAGVTISLLSFQSQGYDSKHGVDAHFERKAKDDGKPTNGLETIGFQLGLFDEMDADTQEEMILQAIEEDKAANEKSEKMMQAFRQGDAEALAKFMNEGFEKFPELKKSLLEKRNESWVEPITKMIAGGKDVLVIVGAGHLCGEHSVIELLEKQGIKPVRVSNENAKGTGAEEPVPSSAKDQ